MNLNNLAKLIHKRNVDKGFYDGPERTALEYHMLIVTELAEASEAVRKNEPDFYINKDGKPEATGMGIKSYDLFK